MGIELDVITFFRGEFELMGSFLTVFIIEILWNVMGFDRQFLAKNLVDLVKIQGAILRSLWGYSFSLDVAYLMETCKRSYESSCPTI